MNNDNKLTFWISSSNLPFIQEQFQEGAVQVLKEEDGTTKIEMIVDAIAACKLVAAGFNSGTSIYRS